jgi:hypothetical protein
MSAPLTHVVEWSDLKNMYRIRTHSEFLVSNEARFHEGVPQDFAPLAFFTNGDEAVRFVRSRGEMQRN